MKRTMGFGRSARRTSGGGALAIIDAGSYNRQRCVGVGISPSTAEEIAMPRMTVTAAIAAIHLCGPALGGDAGTDEIRARLLGTPLWVYEWAKDIPTAPGKVDSGKVSFVEKDGKLIGFVDVGFKCSNEVRLRADGFDFENCRGN